MSPPPVVIFDFDGVLVLTERSTFDFYKELLPQYGIELREEDFALKVGRKSLDFLRDVLKERFTPELAHELTMKKREAFLADIPKYLTLADGALELLEALKQREYTLAIGSQNERPLLEKALETFDMRPYFSFVASLQDITKKKPDPEIFDLVMREVGATPDASVVIEDSPHGIEAANAAGCAAIAITTSFPKEAFPTAQTAVGSLRELQELLQRDGM